MGATCIALSLRYRVPVGDGLVYARCSDASSPRRRAFRMHEAIGAFLVCALLITIAGYSGLFERLLARIPLSIAAPMLAGVLLRFGIDVFTALE